MARHESRHQQIWRRRAGLSLVLVAIALLVLAGGAVALVLRQRTTFVSSPAAIPSSATPGQQTSTLYSTTINDYAAPVHAVPVLGVVVDQQLRVVAVTTGSAADQAGLQPGDIIMRVNSTAISSAAAGKQLIRQARAGQQIVLTVELDGQTLIVPVQPAAPRGQPGQATPTPIPDGLDYF
jgi:membrane-associated protease RseP (regulator of RpoE activity)